METHKIGMFILALLFSGWKNAISLVSMIGIIGFIIAPAMNNNWDIKKTIYIIAGLIIFCFVSKVIRQYYQLFQHEDQKPIAIRVIQGDGFYKGRKILVFENNIRVHKNDIVTMYCNSSGTQQPVCLLRVLDITGSDIITDQYPEEIVHVEPYFEENSRKKATYFTKSIDYNLLESSILDRRK